MFTVPRLIMVLTALAFLALTVGWIYKQGADSLRNSIERQNNAAATRADEGVLDYDACRNAGRVFNFGTGKCLGPAPGRRN